MKKRKIAAIMSNKEVNILERRWLYLFFAVTMEKSLAFAMEFVLTLRPRFESSISSLSLIKKSYKLERVGFSSLPA
jgi:hypothetical protein